MEHKIETEMPGRKDKNNFNANWPFLMNDARKLNHIIIMPSKEVPLVPKIDYDGHINGEKYKVLLMSNLMSMTVMGTQIRREAKRVDKKHLST